MGKCLATNNAVTTLSASISASTTTITLAGGTGSLFPAVSGEDWFYGTLYDSSNHIEIVKVTRRQADSLTVVRGQDGTSALAFSAGDGFDLRPTAALFDDKVSKSELDDAKEDLTETFNTQFNTLNSNLNTTNSSIDSLEDNIADTYLSISNAADKYLPLAGGTLTGALTVNSNIKATGTHTVNGASTLGGYVTINNGLKATGAVTFTSSCAVSGALTANTVRTTSDERAKYNVDELDTAEALDAVLDLEPVSFNWRTEKSGDPKHLGFIAQKVQRVIPEAVGDGANGLLGVDYSNLVAVLTAAVQHQELMIESLAAEVCHLRDEIKELKK